MKIFITGGTGYLGNRLAHQLAEDGHCVHALIRDNNKAPLLQHKHIKLFAGQLNDAETLIRAMEGCEQVYHAAAQVKPWTKDPSAFYKSNVEGTMNVCEQAIRTGVNKLVFTSSTGVLGPTHSDPLTEDAEPANDYSLEYDRTKKIAEDILMSYLPKGLGSVIVNPAKIFGPGNARHGLTINSFIQSFLKRKFTFVPSPSSYRVCFAYIDDVVRGHILAMEKGIPGQRYILGGPNVSYHEFFDLTRRLAGTSARIIAIPKAIAILAGWLQEINHKITGADIRFKGASAGYAYTNFMFSSEKAVHHLGYTITPLEEALTQTIHFLNSTI